MRRQHPFSLLCSVLVEPTVKSHILRSDALGTHDITTTVAMPPSPGHAKRSGSAATRAARRDDVWHPVALPPYQLRCRHDPLHTVVTGTTRSFKGDCRHDPLLYSSLQALAVTLDLPSRPYEERLYPQLARCAPLKSRPKPVPHTLPYSSDSTLREPGSRMRVRRQAGCRWGTVGARPLKLRSESLSRAAQVRLHLQCIVRD